MTDMHVVPMPTKPDEVQAAIESMRRALPVYLELAAINAKVRSAHYKAYLAEGFSEEQALILCQRITL